MPRISRVLKMIISLSSELQFLFCVSSVDVIIDQWSYQHQRITTYALSDLTGENRCLSVMSEPLDGK